MKPIVGRARPVRPDVLFQPSPLFKVKNKSNTNTTSKWLTPPKTVHAEVKPGRVKHRYCLQVDEAIQAGGKYTVGDRQYLFQDL